MTAPSTPLRPEPDRPIARRRGIAIVVGAALLVGLGACSASGGAAAAPGSSPSTTVGGAPPSTVEPTPTTDPSTTDPSTTDPSTVPTTTEPAVPEDLDLDAAQARLDAINLTLDDLPAGWTSEPAVEQSTTVVADCTDHGGPDDVVARSSSDRFSLLVEGGGLGLDTSSGFAADVETAEQLLAEIGSGDFASCASERLLAGGEDVTVEGSFAVVDGLPELGEGVVGLQGDFSLSDSTGQTAHLSMIVVTIRTDQVVTTVSALAYGTPGDEQLLYQVLDLIAARQGA